MKQKSFVCLGTRFNVNLLVDKSIITVVEGKIVIGNISSKKSEKFNQIAIDGQQITIDSKGNISSVILKDVGPVVSWTDNKLIFSGESLEVTLNKINRYAIKKRIEVRDDRLRTLPIYGVFNIGDTRGFLAALEKTYPVHQVSRAPNLTELVYIEHGQGKQKITP